MFQCCECKSFDEKISKLITNSLVCLLKYYYYWIIFKKYTNRCSHKGYKNLMLVHTHINYQFNNEFGSIRFSNQHMNMERHANDYYYPVDVAYCQRRYQLKIVVELEMTSIYQAIVRWSSCSLQLKHTHTLPQMWM